jgi:hypothetical protein
MRLERNLEQEKNRF